MVHQKQEVKRYEHSSCESAEKPSSFVPMNMPQGATRCATIRKEGSKRDPGVVSRQEGQGGTAVPVDLGS